MKNKFLTKILGATLGLAMAIGVGVGVAANNNAAKPVEAAVSTYAHTFSAKPSTGNNITLSTVKWNITATNLNNYNSNYAGVQFGTGSKNGAISLTSASSFSYSSKTIVKEIRVWFNRGGSSVTPTVTVGGVEATSDGTTIDKNSSCNGNYTNATKVTFTPGSTKTGVVVISATSVNAGYICRMEIDVDAASFGTLDHIKVDSPATKLTFEVGETFSSSGLVLAGYDDENEATANVQTYSSGYTTDFDDRTFTNEDIGNKTVTVTYSGKTTTYEIAVVAGPDVVLNGASNKPAGVTSTPNAEPAQGQVGETGINYGYYALQTYGSNLEFNRDVSGAYIGNNDAFAKYIKKIRVTLSSDNFNKLTMYKGNSAIPGETSVVSNENSGVTRTFDFGSSSKFFALKQTTTGTYVQIVKIEIFLDPDATTADVIEGSLSTQFSLSYASYTKHGEGALDALDENNTYLISADSGSSYKNWTNSDFASGVSYKGFTHHTNSSIQMNSNGDYGFITTANTNSYNVSKVTIVWDSHTSNGNTADIYGSNTAYTEVSELFDAEKQGTKIGSIVKGTSTSVTIDGSYKYIGIRSHANALYMTSVSIQWGEIPTYTYGNMGIRFGGSVSEAMWNDLSNEATILGYGVLVTAVDIGSDALKGYKGMAVNYELTPDITDEVVDFPSATATPKKVGNNYVWNLYKNISNSELKTDFFGVAYIKIQVADVVSYVYLQQGKVSAKSLANDLIQSGAYAADAFGGSLAYLANL